MDKRAALALVSLLGLVLYSLGFYPAAIPPLIVLAHLIPWGAAPLSWPALLFAWLGKPWAALAAALPSAYAVTRLLALRRDTVDEWYAAVSLSALAPAALLAETPLQAAMLAAASLAAGLALARRAPSASHIPASMAGLAWLNPPYTLAAVPLAAAWLPRIRTTPGTALASLLPPAPVLQAYSAVAATLRLEEGLRWRLSARLRGVYRRLHWEAAELTPPAAAADRDARIASILVATVYGAVAAAAYLAARIARLKLVAATRASSAEQELPFIVVAAAAAEHAGVKLHEFLRALPEGTWWRREAGIVERLLRAGYSPAEAIGRLAETHPSRRVRVLLQAYATALAHGGDTARLLSEEARVMVDEAVSAMLRSLDKLYRFTMLSVAAVMFYAVLAGVMGGGYSPAVNLAPLIIVTAVAVGALGARLAWPSILKPVARLGPEPFIAALVAGAVAATVVPVGYAVAAATLAYGATLTWYSHVDRLAAMEDEELPGLAEALASAARSNVNPVTVLRRLRGRVAETLARALVVGSPPRGLYSRLASLFAVTAWLLARAGAPPESYAQLLRLSVASAEARVAAMRATKVPMVLAASAPLAVGLVASVSQSLAASIHAYAEMLRNAPTWVSILNPPSPEAIESIVAASAAAGVAGEAASSPTGGKGAASIAAAAAALAAARLLV